MWYKLGRLLQFVGLFVILPVAIVAQLHRDITEGQMLLWAAIGALVFYVGRNIQDRG